MDHMNQVEDRIRKIEDYCYTGLHGRIEALESATNRLESLRLDLINHDFIQNLKNSINALEIQTSGLVDKTDELKKDWSFAGSEDNKHLCTRIDQYDKEHPEQVKKKRGRPRKPPLSDEIKREIAKG